MKIKETFKIIKNDFFLKTLSTSVISLIFTLAFAIYNIYLGIQFSDVFAIGISIYYFLLIWIRTATLIVENKIAVKDEKYKARVRIKNYKISSILIFIIDLCLIAPVILMVTQPKEVVFGIVPAINIAVYSTYKIIVAIINFNRSKKLKNLTIILLKEINIIDAVVSLLSLQHTLIMVNGGMTVSLKILSLISSICLIIIIVIFSIINFIKTMKFNKN